MKKEDIKEASHLGVDQEVFAIDDVCEEAQSIEPGVLLEMDAMKLQEQACCVAYEACLKALATTHVPASCSKCGRTFNLVSSRTGTALYLNWVCVPRSNLIMLTSTYCKVKYNTCTTYMIWPYYRNHRCSEI